MRVYCVVDKKGYFMAARHLVITSWNRIQIYERQRFLKKRFLTKLDFPMFPDQTCETLPLTLETVN